MRAFVFPGQGAQFVGMGADLAANWSSARAVFDEVDDALGEKLSDLILEGDPEKLTLTENAQPALMATSMAAMKALEAEGVGIEAASFVAGHSLGEYSALCAAGALTLSDTARLLRIRGEAMQAAVPVGKGAMAVLLGINFDTAKIVAAKASHKGICEAANDNDTLQVVVSGETAAVEEAMVLAKEAGAKRTLLLPVSAPFHSTMMEPAAKVMAGALDDVDISKPSVPLVSNVLAEPVDDPHTVRSLLVEQITGAVRWRESVQAMAKDGVTEIWEIGAGKALSGMVRRINREIDTMAVGDGEGIRAAVARAKG